MSWKDCHVEFWHFFFKKIFLNYLKCKTWWKQKSWLVAANFSLCLQTNKKAKCIQLNDSVRAFSTAHENVRLHSFEAKMLHPFFCCSRISRLFKKINQKTFSVVVDQRKKLSSLDNGSALFNLRQRVEHGLKVKSLCFESVCNQMKVFEMIPFKDVSLDSFEDALYFRTHNHRWYILADMKVL